MNAFHGNQISGGPFSDQREWLRTMTSRSRTSFSCSQRKTMEKDTGEAIRSVVGSLPKIDQLKPKARTSFAEFCWWPCCCGAYPHWVREKLDFPAGSVCGEGAGPVAWYTLRPNATRLVMADPEWHWADPIILRQNRTFPYKDEWSRGAKF